MRRALESLQAERDGLHRSLAVSDAENKRLDTQLGKSDKACKALQHDKDELAHRLATRPSMAALGEPASHASK